MKPELHCVYYMLLCISIISSTLLFLIVASENTNFIGPDRQNFKLNISLEDSSGVGKTAADVQSPNSLQNSNLVNNFENNFEAAITDGVDVLKDNLIHQPNLSQGISEGEQAHVLTFVDTTKSLKNLKTKESFIAKSGNLSLNDNESPSRIGKIIKNPESDNNETVQVPQVPQVVVVRAEQRKPELQDELTPPETIEGGLFDQIHGDEKVIENNTEQIEISLESNFNDFQKNDDSLNNNSKPVTIVSESNEPQHEDIPSFNEWAQKRLEEAEKKKTHSNASIQTANASHGRGIGSMRTHSKNYASPDCGAKIAAANPESRSSRSILDSTRDEYMLNTCTTRAWFVVELCEAIQAKKIELANFELFSSSPKEFSVYVSDRFPTRDWSLVGHFTAKDERDIQSFHLHPQLFGKFIKVELHSHYGSEHFCPISLFRAYGTSEFEVLETETETDVQSRRGEKEHNDLIAEIDDEDDEDNILGNGDYTETKQKRNLFGSARDAVLSIIKTAAEVLVKTGLSKANNITKIQESIKGDVLVDSFDNCITPKYRVGCTNCSDDRIARVFQVLSCRYKYLESLLESKFIYNSLLSSNACENFGYSEQANPDVRGKKALNKSKNSSRAKFLHSLFLPEYIIALCNILAAEEQKLVTNTSHDVSKKLRAKTQDSFAKSIDKDAKMFKTSPILTTPELTKKSDSENMNKKTKMGVTTDSISRDFIESQIKPTSAFDNQDLKEGSTISIEALKNNQKPNDEKLKITATSTIKIIPVTSEIPNEKLAPDNSEASLSDSNLSSSGDTKIAGKTVDSSDIDSKKQVETIEKEKEKNDAVDHEVKLSDQLNFDNFDFKDLDMETNGGSGIPTSTSEAKVNTPQQKESVFLRLSNRIKVLERNMSLSSQYLEELSKRYKKQVEEMQKFLERSINVLTEDSRKSAEREAKRNEEILILKEEIKYLSKTLENLIDKQASWQLNLSSLCQRVIFVLLDVVLVILILSYCRRAEDLDYEDVEVDQSTVQMNRGRSYEIIKEKTHKTKKQKQRRPSEIASHISGTYNKLMIEDGIKKEKRKKRKKSSVIIRTLSSKECRRNSSFLDVVSDELIQRSASTSDALYSFSTLNFNHLSKVRRPDSAPENKTLFNNYKCIDKIQVMTKSDNEALNISNDDSGLILEELSSSLKSKLNCQTSLPIELETNKSKNKISSPSFMKTAFSCRTKRLTSNNIKKPETSSEEKNEERLVSFSDVNNRVTNGQVDECGESSNNLTTPVKSKANGLRKMVRKFF